MLRFLGKVFLGSDRSLYVRLDNGRLFLLERGDRLSIKGRNTGRYHSVSVDCMNGGLFVLRSSSGSILFPYNANFTSKVRVPFCSLNNY